MDHLEYLLNYGLAGDFGRFRSGRPVACRRGDRAVVRTHRGLEIGRVLREATPRHAHFLPNTTVGTLLRLAGPDDDRIAERMGERARLLFDRARRTAKELALPLEVIDVEVLLDGEHGVLHLLRFEESDVRPFVERPVARVRAAYSADGPRRSGAGGGSGRARRLRARGLRRRGRRLLFLRHGRLLFLRDRSPRRSGNLRRPA